MRIASPENERCLTRRGLFQQVGSALYAAALTQLLGRDLYGGAGGSGRRSVYDLKPRRPEHEPRAKAVIHLFMNGRPSLGAWVSYGLGTENQNLPAYVVLDDPQGLPVNGIDNWTSGYLPPLYQGTRFRATGAPVLDLKPDFDEPEAITRLERELIARLDQLHQSRRPERPQLAARISSYELAARMQIAATDAPDLSQETAATLTMY